MSFKILALAVLGFMFSESGLASWYGPGFAGNPTANGEIFDPMGMTAAHKTRPLGTRALVICPLTGRMVLVRINDRGPYVAGRFLDLSQGAAEALGIIEQGVAPVIVFYLGKW